MAVRNLQPKPKGIFSQTVLAVYQATQVLWKRRYFFAYLYLWLALPWTLAFYHFLLRWPGTDARFVLGQLFTLHPTLLLVGKVLLIGALMDLLWQWKEIRKQELLWPTAVGIGWVFYLVWRAGRLSLPLPTLWAPLLLWGLGAVLALVLALGTGLLGKEKETQKP
jgi:uncharacterized membrane protein YhhN